MLPLSIIFEDDHILVVNKPAGLLTVPGLTDPQNLHDSLKKHYPNARVVHRLDMATSGCIIFALHHQAQKILGQCFEKREMHKRYTAVLHGILPEDRGAIDVPLLCDWPNRPKQKVDWINGKSAHTQFNVISRDYSTHTTRVLLTPRTGRSHQLRVHMLHLGFPIVGDNFYATAHEAHQHNTRLHLHAEELRFHHPITNIPVNIKCLPSF